MITKRIIPCLDVKDGRVVKGVNFNNLNDVSSPVALGKYYSDNGADELVFYDITASSDGRKLFTEILTEVAENIFIPLTVGGGINTIEDFDRVLKCGADKVSVNSGAIKNPDLIKQGALKYGDQCVVISADVKRVDGKFTVFAKGGRENTGIEAATEIEIKYKGYIQRERELAERMVRLENIRIKDRFDYNSIESLSTEARQKLTAINPDTLAQASRIPGVSPSDINVLLVLVRK